MDSFFLQQHMSSKGVFDQTLFPNLQIGDSKTKVKILVGSSSVKN